MHFESSARIGKNRPRPGQCTTARSETSPRPPTSPKASDAWAVDENTRCDPLRESDSVGTDARQQFSVSLIHYKVARPGPW